MNTPRTTILCLAGLAGLALLGGCVQSSTTSAGQINMEPLTIDPAMQNRQWEPATAYYANGDTVTWSTGFGYEPDPAQPNWQYYFSDTGTYFVNLVTMPYTFYQQRDGVASTGVQIPPTYTAVPPLPPSPEVETVESAPTTQPTP